MKTQTNIFLDRQQDKEMIQKNQKLKKLQNKRKIKQYWNELMK